VTGFQGKKKKGERAWGCGFPVLISDKKKEEGGSVSSRRKGNTRGGKDRAAIPSALLSFHGVGEADSLLKRKEKKKEKELFAVPEIRLRESGKE